MPEILALAQKTSAKLVTFAQCSFGAPWQKFTTLMFSAGFESWLDPLNRLECSHRSHDQAAGGLDEHGEWTSGAAAAYPADFNYYVARAIQALAISSISASGDLLVRKSDAPTEDNVETRAAELKLKAPASTTRVEKPPPVTGGLPLKPTPGKPLTLNS